MRYATATKVSVSRTQEHLRKLLREHRAAQIVLAEDDATGRAALRFVLHNRQIHFALRLPDPLAPAFTQDRRGSIRPAAAARKLWEQACRSSWRELFLLVKAMLVAVSAEITSFEELFLPYLVTTNGQTVAQRVLPDLPALLTTGRSSLLLLPPGAE